MSNTLDLSRVVFTRRWVESDRDRKRKWVDGAWSVAPEVTVNRSVGDCRRTDSIGSGGVSSSWQESIGLLEASSHVRENISQPWGETSALHVKYKSFLKLWGDTIALTACNSRSLRYEAKVNITKHCTRPLYLVLLSRHFRPPPQLYFAVYLLSLSQTDLRQSDGLLPRQPVSIGSDGVRLPTFSTPSSTILCCIFTKSLAKWTLATATRLHRIRWSPFADIFDPLLNYTLQYIY